MRTLLVLLSVVLISGCAARSVEDRKAWCLSNQDKLNGRGHKEWNDATNKCKIVWYNNGAPVAEPIIDKGTASFDATQYASDLSACRQYANQVASQTLDNALGGLLLGAAFGAIVDSSLDTSGGARTGALTGALGGGVQGAASTHQGRALVLRKCLAGRGYSVLDM